MSEVRPELIGAMIQSGSFESSRRMVCYLIAIPEKVTSNHLRFLCMNIPQSQSIPHPFADTPINKIYDVVIVGAGPVGLATAVGLRKRGIDNILVVDQTRAFRYCWTGCGSSA